MRITKKDIYAAYGIEYKKGKIFCDVLNAWINPVLKNGNKKIGKGVATFSITAGNKKISEDIIRKVTENLNKEYTETEMHTLRVMCGGTCSVSCPGCYAQSGCYQFFSTKVSLAKNTYIAHTAVNWLFNAICAQIEADKFKAVRIHAAGDFFSVQYVDMWSAVADRFHDVIMWTYTKQRGKFAAMDAALDRFEAHSNCNIVKSLTEDGKVNYGTALYIMMLYKELKAQGKAVYICRCGIDKEQHCNDCKHCSEAEYVLFLEHGTAYKPENDPDFPAFVELVNSQNELESKAA